MPNIPIKRKNEGKGWGDGTKVRAYTKRRKRQEENTYTGFRPRIYNEAAYYVIREWCDDERINLSLSSLFNAIIPGLKIACENTTEKDEETGRISIELNLGRIEIFR